MKKLAVLLAFVVLLAGCSGSNAQMDRVLALRSKLLQGKGCRFDAVITADYGKNLYEFTLQCTADEKGNLEFTVIQPESIAGISGRISAQGGALTFDDQALAFDLLAEGQFSPVSAPWIFLKTIRSGYIRACGVDDEYLLANMEDSYADDALQLDVWLGQGDLPIRGEILYAGRRCLSMDVKNFQIL